ncbi:hypothetical protein FRB96_008122 [Tulasnella sp. 330]|nr:hypothetical protein FRB96_008122 [Tulasnella sp. 330]KAG8884446.1 hypothetical protein FRB97_004220 [Tulasnella sp. 331]KAG8885402.1 hypothetical protein FRB98_001821 [Tulasnella sp. 332]
MPKVINPSIPLNGLFAVAKPSGITCMSMLNKIRSLLCESPLFVDPSPDKTIKQKRRKQKGGGPVKIGQGGTLDPLADGVLVIGIGKGTKSLGEFINSTKEYRSTGILGCETDSYDSDGARVRLAPWTHVTRSDVEKVLAQFRGPIKQMPPVYSALKMDGKPLYEYAREGKPLPRPIVARDAHVYDLELVDWREAYSEENPTGHKYIWPTKELLEEDREQAEKVKSLLIQADAARPTEDPVPPTTTHLIAEAQYKATNDPTKTAETLASSGTPPAFVIKMTVSSGTYVRSIVHDIGLALGSAAHVVTLKRTKQGDFSLGDDDGSGGDCVPWHVFEKAFQDHDNGVLASPVEARADESLRAEWEKEIFFRWHEK